MGAHPDLLSAVWTTLLGFIFTTASSQDQLAGLVPPDANIAILSFIGKGDQIYRCPASLQYEYQGAEAELFAQNNHHPHKQKLSDDWSGYEDNLVDADIDVEEQGEAGGSMKWGYHYFLPRPDAGDGKPTFALLNRVNDSSAIPSSTATFRVISSVAAKEPDKNIPSLLLMATSHSGRGPLSIVSYAQRLNAVGGMPPSNSCSAEGALIRSAYHARYRFWSQINTPPSTTPAEIMVPSTENNKRLALVASFFGQGYQIYTFNGMSWILTNASAGLSSLPGNPVLGRHYFLGHRDPSGGQASWEFFSPRCRISTKLLHAAQQTTQDIPWILTRATSYVGELSFASRILYVQRWSTRGGLAPTSSVGARPGDTYQSPYTATYSLYGA